MGSSRDTKKSGIRFSQTKQAQGVSDGIDDSPTPCRSDSDAPLPKATFELRRQSAPDTFSLAEVLPPLPASMSYAPVQSTESDAYEQIDLASQENLASFALSLRPGKLSPADLQAMRLLNVAQASRDGKLKEVNDALTGLEKLVVPKETKTVTNNTVILAAMERVNRRKGLLEEQDG